ncbi:ISA1 [Candida pseudojiufengensis]|uniref:ISA1 n=1 Tax=Candida pseudojiufengensis TaxID=497109 RepID=UPI0022259ECA|nr:ISA1 [Candida pseudojiufengensis]KAI5963122.1 ISA1 [Candida pseudojiufengensis]
MIARRSLSTIQLTKRFLSQEIKTNSSNSNKRYIQTIPLSTGNTNPSSSSFFYNNDQNREPKLIDRNDTSSNTKTPLNKWAKHSLGFPSSPISSQSPKPQQQIPQLQSQSQSQSQVPVRRSRTSRFKKETMPQQQSQQQKPSEPASEIIDIAFDPETQAASSSIQNTKSTQASIPKTTSTIPTTNTTSTPKKKRTLKPRKALITLSSNAIKHLQALLDQPTPKLIRIGVRNRGCSGLTYNLEYVDKPGKFDETVEQDGVKVLIDSKALFSIVGSEMDWLDDKLSSRFIFKNPNSKGTCGCGESFMV